MKRATPISKLELLTFGDTKMKDQKQAMFEADRAAEIGHKKYKKQVEALESKSLLSKARSVNAFDIQAMCKQLDQWKSYESFVMHEAGNLNLLGKLPKIALTTRAFAH